MPKFLFTYRVPQKYQPGEETGKAWEAWFERLGTRTVDVGRAVLVTRTVGNPGAGTRLGGYSLVEADDLDGAAALAERCPALEMGGGLEIGAIPELMDNPPTRAGA